MNIAMLLAVATKAKPAASGNLFLIVLPLMLVVYFAFLRPQRQKALRKQKESASFEVGDDVATVGGIVGRVTSMEDDRVWLELDAGVVVEFLRPAISKRLDPPPGVEQSPVDMQDGVASEASNQHEPPHGSGGGIPPSSDVPPQPVPGLEPSSGPAGSIDGPSAPIVQKGTPGDGTGSLGIDGTHQDPLPPGGSI